MHLSTYDQRRVTALLATARNEILSLVPSWSDALRDAYLHPRTNFRIRTRVVVSRSGRAQASGLPDHVDVRLGTAFATFFLIVDQRAALIRTDGRQFGLTAVPPADLDHQLGVFEDQWKRSSPIDPVPTRPMSDLQLSIIRRLATGMTDQAAAKDLNISPRTVQRQVSHVMELLGARSRLELGVYLATTDLL
jgi:DNA-binding CsgD family transcriptional regulator